MQENQQFYIVIFLHFITVLYTQYSGLFLTDETNLLYGVFLLSNRTEEAMTNIGITLSVATEDDVLFDNKSH